MSTTITAAEVNKLRQQTGAGMMDCKKALMEANGDFEAAIDYLRKKGQKIAANRADRDANEGAVIALSDGKKGVVIYLTSETDFVAKNDGFVSLAKSIAEAALKNMPANTEALTALQLNGKSIKDLLLEEVARIGEKIEIARYEKLEAEGVVPYIHAGNKIGVLIALNKPLSGAIEAVGKDVAMQVAAMNPVAVDEKSVDKSTIERELEIAREQIRAEGKPADMVEKIAQGKLNKFYKEATLLNQQFVKDGSKAVKDVLKAVDGGLTVVKFFRVATGK